MVLHVDGAELAHALALPVQVVLPLLVGVGQHRVGGGHLGQQTGGRWTGECGLWTVGGGQ